MTIKKKKKEYHEKYDPLTMKYFYQKESRVEKIALKSTVSELTKRLEDISLQNKSMKRSLKNHQIIHQLEKELLLQKIANLEKVIVDRDGEINDLKGEIGTLNQQMSDLYVELQEKKIREGKYNLFKEVEQEIWNR